MNLTNIGPVVVVGPGKMALAMARGWLAAGLPANDLVLVNPGEGKLAKAFIAEHGGTLVPTVEGLHPRILLMAVKPQKFAEVMPQVKGAVGPETVVVSVAAGLSIAAIQAGLGTKKIVRTMPNTPSQVGKGMTGAVAPADVNAAERAAVDALLKASGKVVWFEDEAKIDMLTAISGSGPAYVFHVVEAMASAGEKLGLTPDEAMLLARQTIVGAAALLEADADVPASVLRENVTSPNGTTAAALAVLMGAEGIGPVFDKATAAARARAEELGKLISG